MPQPRPRIPFFLSYLNRGILGSLTVKHKTFSQEEKHVCRLSEIKIAECLATLKIRKFVLLCQISLFCGNPLGQLHTVTELSIGCAVESSEMVNSEEF